MTASISVRRCRSGQMTEHARAIRDLRDDIICEVAGSMPDASAQEVVTAIVRRLSGGLPALVAVGLKSAGCLP